MQTLCYIHDIAIASTAKMQYLIHDQGISIACAALGQVLDVQSLQ